MTFDRDNALQMFLTTTKDIYVLLQGGKVKGAIHKCKIVIDALETIKHGLKSGTTRQQSKD
jgi:hypothetical protein